MRAVPPQFARSLDMKNLLLLLSFAGLAAVAAPVGARESDGLANCRGIANGIVRYASEHDGVLPYVEDQLTLMVAVRDVVGDYDAWQTGVAFAHFKYNSCVGGVRLADVQDPANVPLVYGTAGSEGGRRLVGFCDGHVERCGPARWAFVEAGTHLKLARSAKKPLPKARRLPPRVGPDGAPIPEPRDSLTNYEIPRTSSGIRGDAPRTNARRGARSSPDQRIRTSSRVRA
jgi:prepilin-type processing-associated H-X9-DG protein